jgi:hypothetical protein
MKRSHTMILIPDSDDDKLEDDNKKPFLTKAQKENFKKEWAHEKKVEELQGKRHAWPEQRINESIRCVTKEHGDQCQGLMPSCKLMLVADLDCFHENAAKQKKEAQEGGAFKKHQEPEGLQGEPVSSEAEAEAGSSISSNRSQLHDFCDANQLPEYEETLVDFCDETQVPDYCDETQPDF